MMSIKIITKNLGYLNTHLDRLRVGQVLELKVEVPRLKVVRWRKRSSS